MIAHMYCSFEVGSVQYTIKGRISSELQDASANKVKCLFINLSSPNLKWYQKFIQVIAHQTKTCMPLCGELVGQVHSGAKQSIPSQLNPAENP